MLKLIFKTVLLIICSCCPACGVLPQLKIDNKAKKGLNDNRSEQSFFNKKPVSNRAADIAAVNSLLRLTTIRGYSIQNVRRCVVLKTIPWSYCWINFCTVSILKTQIISNKIKRIKIINLMTKILCRNYFYYIFISNLDNVV